MNIVKHFAAKETYLSQELVVIKNRTKRREYLAYIHQVTRDLTREEC